MYEKHFHLRATPFSIAPDPAFLYLSAAHREALAHLMYGFNHGGFVLITGEVGTGKTTLLRNLLKQTPPDLDVAFVLNPRLTVRELLETLCDELGIHYNKPATTTVKQYIDALTRHLLNTHREGRSTVLIIDEAQNLSPAVLEQIRLLTNLETDERKLLRIILLGQPELADLLARDELRQLAQRITARYHLGSLNRQDAYAYVMHRLSRAGGNPNLFTAAALRRLFALSHGTPRIINVIADRALLGAYAEGKQQVTAGVVGRAATEVLGRRADRNRWLIGAAAVVGVTGAAWAFWPAQTTPPSEIAPANLELNATAVERLPAIEAGTEVARPPVSYSEIPVDTVESLPAVIPLPAVDTPSTDMSSNAEPTLPGAVIRNAPEVSANAGEVISPATRPMAEGITEVTTIQRPDGGSFAIQRQAYRALFQRWGVDFDSASTAQIPCDFAPSAGLQCLSQRGDWGDISRLDLPVVLELWDAAATPFHATLTHIDDGRVTLALADRRIETTMRDLRDTWSGAYVVLWQTPPGYRGNIREGDSHETVGWLRVQLSNLTDRPLASANPTHFDEGLVEAVTEFQRVEGLMTDGVVGPATWIRLATRLALPQPGLDNRDD